jgi:hypothetical protein
MCSVRMLFAMDFSQEKAQHMFWYEEANSVVYVHLLMQS